MKFTIHHFITSILLSSLIALCGCGINTPKQPHVRMESATYPVVFADNVTKLRPSEQEALADFISTVPASAVSTVLLTTDDGNARSIARARSIRDYLIYKGFDKNIIRLEPSVGMDPTTVVLTLQYAKGVPPEPCPDWSDSSFISYQESTSSNFGCAYYNNIIVQLANPADYNNGHGTPTVEAPRDSVFLQKYFAGTSASGSTTSSASSSGGGGGSTTTTSSTP